MWCTLFRLKPAEDGWSGQPKHSTTNFKIIYVFCRSFQLYLLFHRQNACLMLNPDTVIVLGPVSLSEHGFATTLDKCLSHATLSLVSCKWACLFYQAVSPVLVLRMFKNECLRVETFNVQVMLFLSSNTEIKRYDKRMYS